MHAKSYTYLLIIPIITCNACRKCQLCNTGIGDETHILIDCHILTTHINDLHKALGRKVHGFCNMSKEEKGMQDCGVLCFWRWNWKTGVWLNLCPSHPRVGMHSTSNLLMLASILYRYTQYSPIPFPLLISAVCVSRIIFITLPNLPFPLSLVPLQCIQTILWAKNPDGELPAYAIFNDLC